MSAKQVPMPIIDDVTSDDELIAFFNVYRKTFNILGYQAALASAQIKAMLRAHDKRSRNRRAHKVARPMALLAGVMVAAAKLCALAAKRFQIEYAPEIGASRQSRRGRTMNFGNQGWGP
jgi:hypothetical protein